MTSLRVNVCDEDSLAVTSDRIFKDICQLALTIGYMLSLFIAGTNDNLL
jgi:hypothetical protein